MSHCMEPREDRCVEADMSKTTLPARDQHAEAKAPKNRADLTLEQRGAIHLLNRATKHLMKQLGKMERPKAIDHPVIATKAILDACSAAVFHGGEPSRK